MATRWGICSAGKISNDFVVALRTLSGEEHKIVAIAAQSLGRAQEFAQKYDIPMAYNNYESLAKDINVDVVYIGSLNPSHVEHCTLMLNNGKHVLCEKPATMVYEDTKKIIALAKEKQLFFMEAVWSNFIPSYIQLEEELNQGSIGDVRAINVSFGFRNVDPSRTTKRSLGGSATLDIGIYCLNLALRGFRRERPLKVQATGYVNTEGVDEVVSVTMLYSNGRIATLSFNLTVDLESEAIIYGTNGYIKVPKPFWSTDTLITNEKTYKFPLIPTIGSDKCVYVNSTNLRYEAIEVRRCIKEGLLESPRMSHEDTLFLAEYMTEIQKQVGSSYSPQLE